MSHTHHIIPVAPEAVNEARNQRIRIRQIDDNITKLAAAQLVTEEKLDESIAKLSAAQLLTEETLRRFISSLARGRNGR